MSGRFYYLMRRVWSNALMECVQEDRNWSVRTLYKQRT